MVALICIWKAENYFGKIADKCLSYLKKKSYYRPCEIALKQLETIDDDAEKFSVDFVKVIDKRLAKQYHVQTFPTLTMFRDGEMTPFIGDLTNAAQVK